MPVTETLKNATYVTIGFGLLGFQKAQVRRHELSKQLSHQWSQVETQLAGQRQTVTALAAQLAEQAKGVGSLAAQLDEYVVPVRAQVETGLDNLEAILPAPVQDLVGQARAALSEQERALRARLGLPAVPRAA